MTDTLPARTEDRNLAPADYNLLKRQAQDIAKSGLAPKSVSTPDKILVIAMKGRELGLPAMQSLSHIHVIDGKPTMSAELMVALVQRAGHELRVIETDARSCTVEGVRADDPDYRPCTTFSIEDAKTAGVAGKGPWKQYPAAMLRARAISALCRFAFADVLGGVSYVPEELGAAVGEDGQVVGTGLTPDRGGAEEDRDREVEEADVVEEAPEPDLCTVEQANELRVLANQLFDDKSVELSGANWLEDRLGKRINELTASRAAALIEKYGEALNDEAPDGEWSHALAEAGRGR